MPIAARGPASSRLAALSLAALLAITACSDRATGPSGPANDTAAPAYSLGVTSGIPTGKVVVVFADSAAIPQAGLDLIGTLGGTVTRRWDDIGVAFVAGLDAAALGQLQASGLVASIGADRILNWLPGVRAAGARQGAPGIRHHNDPWNAAYFADGTQWNMRVIQADRAWRAGSQGSPNVRVAILDTGIDYGHRELAGLVDLGASASFSGYVTGADTVEVTVPVEPQLPGDEPYMDNHFHGTHVASTVASNAISVAGVTSHATLIAVKVLNFEGSGTFESVATGIRHAAGPANADIINMSLGAMVEPTDPGVPALLEMMRRVIQWAESEGTIVINASGNDGTNLDAGTVVSTPCEQATICVSATGPLLQQNFDQPSTYTNYGITAIEVAAPGGNFVDGDDTAYQTEDLVIGACSRRASDATLNVCRVNAAGLVYFYAYAAGTSMASPHVAGEAALIKAANPTLSVKALRDRILKTADDVGVKGRDAYSNHGRINVWRAIGGR